MSKILKKNISFIDFIFYANSSTISWVLILPFLYSIIGVSSFAVIMVAMIIVFLINIVLSSSTTTPQHQGLMLKLNHLFSKAYFISVCFLPVLISKNTSISVSDHLKETGLFLSPVIIQLILISLVYILALISTKVLRYISRVLAIPLIIYSVSIVLVMVIKLLSNGTAIFQNITIIPSLSWYEFAFWCAYSILFFSSINIAKGFVYKRKVVDLQTVSNTRYTCGRYGLLFPPVIVILLSTTDFFAPLVSIQLLGIFLICALVFDSLSQYALSADRGEIFGIFKNTYTKQREFLIKSLIFIFAALASLLNIQLIIGMASILGLAVILYKMIEKLPHINWVAQIVAIIVWFSCLILLYSIVVDFEIWFLIITFSLVFLVNYLATIIKKLLPSLFVIGEILLEFVTQMPKHKEISVSHIVNIQTTLVFGIVILISACAWIFSENLEFEMHSDMFDLIIFVLILLYYCIVIVLSMVIVPKVKYFDKVKNDLETANTNLQLDIKKREIVEKNLMYTSTHDSLTGLFSRDYMIALLKKRLKKHDNFHLIYIDINRFSKLNDLYGHVSGDRMIQDIADKVRSIYGFNAVVSRFSGDEFLIVVPKAVTQTVQQQSNELIEYFKSNYILNNIFVSLSLRIGIYKHTKRDLTVDSILKNIDFVVRYAKMENLEFSVVYNKEIEELFHKKLRFEKDIKERIQYKDFTQFYQPIYDTKNQKVIGFEQLLRIFYKGKYCLPAGYIEVAEETGLAIGLSWLVIEDACKTIRYLKNKGSSCYIGVNLSPNLFTQPNFVKELKAMCNHYRVNPSSLRLEITEYTLVNEDTNMRAIMNQLTISGFRLLLDDFGTGFSNMSYLKNMPIDTLKIDQSFIRNYDTTGQAVVRAIAFLAKELSLNVIAEGVEEQSQLESLNNAGIYNIQGYLISKPIPRKLLISFIENL